MIAYLHKAPGNTYQLTIVARPCRGEEFNAGEKITVSGKREARTICAQRGITPHNF
jgi:hypothetical protein